MYENGAAFLASPSKSVSLMGMSNIGKTTLAGLLPTDAYFHYSVDYRIATRYLDEQIKDNILAEAMCRDSLAELLKADAFRVALEVTNSNLSMVSWYLGKLGSCAFGGVPENVFRARLDHHRRAEISAVADIPDFMQRGRRLRCSHFVNDLSGSFCEIVDPANAADPLMRAVLDNSVLLYIEPTEAFIGRLIERAMRVPKPLFYRAEFLDEVIPEYMVEHGLTSSDEIIPDAFVRWVYPKLLAARLPRYEQIACNGYTVSVDEVSRVSSEDEFLALVAKAIDRKPARREENNEGTPILPMTSSACGPVDSAMAPRPL